MTDTNIALRKVLIVSFLFLFVSACIAQDNNVLGTKTPYKAQQTKYTPAPKGYTPVFINYVGRHGSRFLTGAGSDIVVKDVLQLAQQQNALTKQGIIILEQLNIFTAIEKDNYGNITMLGKQEQHDIAVRMQQQNAAVFQNKKLLVEMTEKTRTQQSAYAFLSGLKGYDSSLIEKVIFQAKSDSILRFYDLSPKYDAYVESDKLKAHIDTLQNDARTKKIADAVCSKLFAAAFIQQLNDGKISSAGKKKEILNTISLAQALYDVYCILFSAQIEMGLKKKPFINSLQNIFSSSDLYWLNELNNAEDFYEKGPADDTLGIQATIASPLLRDLVTTTDSNINNKNYDGIFRFTHAEAISPLATLMGISQAAQPANSVYNFSKGWQAGKIIPLSANIQWIIYSNGKDYLLKVLLNEKEVKLPVSTSNFPYYKWNDVKNYYLAKISNINLQ